MSVIDKAIDLVPLGETAIVFLTRGDFLTWNPDGTGATGPWKCTPQRRRLNRVIIYFEQGDHLDIDILVGNYDGAVYPVEVGKYVTPGRWMITMTDIKKVGTTSNNWKKFADAGTNPVRYLSKPA